jgi:hypothetical protein
MLKKFVYTTYYYTLDMTIFANIYWSHNERVIMAALNISLPHEMRDWIDS